MFLNGGYIFSFCFRKTECKNTFNNKGLMIIMDIKLDDLCCKMDPVKRTQ